jgi:ferritin-like metal-binding protein YciE
MTSRKQVNGVDQMASEKKLDELFHHTLQDIYYAEKQILKAIPKMMAGAKSAELKKAFELHKGQTEVHVTRLEEVFKIIGEPAKGVKCDAIEGILKEGEGALADFGNTVSGDAAIIAAAQAVEHYEITRYGTLRRWAMVLGLKEAQALLEQTLAEESTTNADLTSLADSYANKLAA